jgi:hypothetical protein
VGSHASRDRLVGPAVVLASLALLQPGIDPVFLTVLSAAHGVPPEFHGWIVGATQASMALGSAAAWLLGARLPQRLFTVAALGALAASLATVHFSSSPALLGARALYGLCMGLLYTQAMARAANNRPSGSYGAVFLVQLVLSSGVALLLPPISDALGARAALLTLCLTPLVVLATHLSFPVALGTSRVPAAMRIDEHREPVSTQGWLYAGSALAFICTTMMLWSFAAAVAMGAGISDDTVGQAVALGSVAGALSALVVMRERSIVPPVLTGLVAGATLLAPLAMASAGDASFVFAIVLFNIGSTAIIVRTSGLAASVSRDALFSRFVTCTHSLGMIAGPVIGGLATWTWGSSGLVCAAVLTTATGCVLLGLASASPQRRRFAHAALQQDRPLGDAAAIGSLS